MATLFFGDPHGDFAPLLRQASRLGRADTVVIVGDLDLMAPFRATLAPLFERQVTVKWIIGNHDVADREAYDLLMTYPEGDIGGVIYSPALGPSIAGLGGVFLERIWYPRPNPEVPWHFECREDRLASLAHFARWRGGLPLRERGAIYPWDVSKFEGRRADVLVSHEAPTSHHYAFATVDLLAAELRAQWVVHGHHHRSYIGILPSGILVKGLGLAEVWEMPT